MLADAPLREQVQAEILKMILATLKEVLENQGKTLPRMSAEATLYGQGSDVDSFGFVQLLIDLEERVNSCYGVGVTTTDQKAMSQRNSPFRTVQSLAEYMTVLVLKAQSENGLP